MPDYLNVLKHRRDFQCPEPLRSDTITAWNICILKGYIDASLCWRFMPINGKWCVEMWEGDRHNPNGKVLWTPCEEIIATAHEPIGVIRGYAH